MDYSAMIQNRKSVRGFLDKKVSAVTLAEVEAYYQKECQRLVPSLETELRIFGSEAREALEGSAGYENFLIGAPQYLVLLSAEGEYAEENAGFMMEDMILKLTEMDLGSCWVTFADADKVKEALKIDSSMKVAAIAAFGYAKKQAKRLRLNILSMSNVDIQAKRHYYDPKVGIDDMVFMNEWGNSDGVDDQIGFYDDMLWEAFYAATLTPSYLNRQPYGFVIRDHRIFLVRKPDDYTDEVSAKLGLGIVMLHFSGATSKWSGKMKWELGQAGELSLPEGYTVAAACNL